MPADGPEKMKVADLARRLGLHPQSVRRYVAAGYLKPWTADGTLGKGKDILIDAGEAEAFVKGGAPAAKAYREQREAGDVAPTRRGRGRKKVTA